MAGKIIVTNLEAKIYLELTPGEAAALGAIVGYGHKPFLEWFERNLGKHYIAPYRNHLESLFNKARGLDTRVQQFEKDRKEFSKTIEF